MWAFRPLLRRGATRAATGLPSFRRLQHGHYSQEPPHKEYFQTPGQTPFPEQPVAYQIYQPPAPSFIQSQQPSYLHRGLRSVFWSSLFGALGLTAGAGLITWEYVNSPIDLDEEEEEEFLQDILADLREHPLVLSLIEEKWQIREVYPQRSTPEMEEGLELLYEKLIGTRGITIHEFTHPTEQYTILVFYLTDGLEGWPDTVHGGVISAMLLLAARRHLDRICSESNNVFNLDPDTINLNVNFVAPVHPEDIYSVLVPPAFTRQVRTEDGQSTSEIQLFPTMMQINVAPQIESKYHGTELHHNVIVNDTTSIVHANASVTASVTPNASVTASMMQRASSDGENANESHDTGRDVGSG